MSFGFGFGFGRLPNTFCSHTGADLCADTMHPEDAPWDAPESIDAALSSHAKVNCTACLIGTGTQSPYVMHCHCDCIADRQRQIWTSMGEHQELS